MAVRRRARPGSKAGPSAPTVRVHGVDSLQQWRNMLTKAQQSGRLVVVQFFQMNNYACAQMRSYYRRMSTDGPLRAALFAEVDVDAAEDALLAECNMRPGSSRIPAYRCYVGGEAVESYVGGVPAEVVKMVQRQLAELKKARGGGLLPRLLKAAGLAAAAAAGVAAYLHWGRGSSSGGGGKVLDGSLGEELRSVSQRINIAQQRMRNAERAGKLKAANNQRRILKQLESQQRSLTQQLQQRQTPGEATAASSSRSRKGSRSSRASATGGGERAASPAGQRRRRNPYPFSDDEGSADERVGHRRGSRPTVLYSDEE